MQIQAASFADGELVVRAPFAPNRNVHGTAFAGSLFTVCVLTAWGRIWLALRARGLDGRIVVADSRIDYRKAVTGDLICRCTNVPNIDAFAADGRIELPMTCTIDGPRGPAVQFDGRYVVLRSRHA